MSLAPLLGGNLRLRQLALMSWLGVVFLMCVHETMTMIPASPLALFSCCSEDKTLNISCGGCGLHKLSLVHACSFLFQLAALCLLQLGRSGLCSIPFTWRFLCSVWTKRIMVSYVDWPVVTLCSGLNLKTTSPGRPWRCHFKHPHFNLNFCFLNSFCTWKYWVG